MEAQTHWIRPNDWLEIVRREYLVQFIRPGGSAVKVVIPKELADHEEFLRGLRALAEVEGFLFASVAAETTKIHLIDKLFFEVASQIPWKELADSFVRRLLECQQYRIPGRDESLTLDRLAALNERDETTLGNDVKKLLEKALIRDFDMCQEFRFAVIEMCLEALDQGRVEVGVVEDWLRGELRLISSLKSCLIFQKIARHNARHILLSLAHWVRLAGRQGLVLTFDVSRYLVDRRPQEPDGQFYYTRAATLEVYEVLRQFIDGTDESEGCFVAVIAPPDFLSHERRGLGAYQALQFRVQDEVWDQRLPNPLATLVWVSSGTEAAGIAAQGGQS